NESVQALSVPGMIIGSINILNVLINSIVTVKKTAGLISGNVTEKNFRIREAPSISAASSNSLGTLARAGKYMRILPPTPHNLTKITAGFAHSLAPDQPGPSMPIIDNKPFI